MIYTMGLGYKFFQLNYSPYPTRRMKQLYNNGDTSEQSMTHANNFDTDEIEICNEILHKRVRGRERKRGRERERDIIQAVHEYMLQLLFFK